MAKEPKVLLCGHFSGMTHAEARLRLARRGIRAAWSFSAALDAVIVGDRPGAVVEQARAAGIAILDQESLASLMRGMKLENAAARSVIKPVAPEPVNDVMTRLREAAHAAPSALAWEQLCAAFDVCPEEGVEVAVDYASDALARWPLRDEGWSNRPVSPLHPTDLEVLGMAPQRWIKTMSLGLSATFFDLIRGMVLNASPYDTNTMAPSRILKVLESPSLKRLAYLKIGGETLDVAFFKKIQSAGVGAQLQHLHLNRITLSPTFNRALVGELWPRLDHLTLEGLYGTRVDPVASLRPLIERVTALDLVAVHLPDLAGLSSMLRLKRLRLVHNNITRGHVATLAGGAFENLERLTLNLSQIGHIGASALFASEGLKGLKRLDLSYCGFSHRALPTLASAEHLSGLEWLVLENNRFNDRAAMILAAAPTLGSLTHLSLARNQLGADAAAHLTASSRLGALKALNLAGNALGDSLAGGLARRPGLSGLEELDLSGTGLTERGLALLAEARCAPHLRRLRVADNGLPPEAVAALKDALPPGCAIDA